MEERQTAVHQMKLIKGIFKPREVFSGLTGVEQISGVGRRLVLLALFNALVWIAVYRLFGMPDIVSQQIQQAVSQVSEETLLTVSIVLAGLTGLVLALLVPTIAGLIYWPFFRDTGYKQLFTINMYTLFVSMIGFAIQLALFPVFHFQPTTYLSLGSFTRLLTDDVFINTLFGGITLFLIWRLYILIIAVSSATRKSKSYVAFVLIMVNIVLLLLSSGAAVFLESETFLKLTENFMISP